MKSMNTSSYTYSPSTHTPLYTHPRPLYVYTPSPCMYTHTRSVHTHAHTPSIPTHTHPLCTHLSPWQKAFIEHNIFIDSRLRIPYPHRPIVP